MENKPTIEQELEWAINGAKTWTEMMQHFNGVNHAKYIECKITRNAYLEIIIKLTHQTQIEIK